MPWLDPVREEATRRAQPVRHLVRGELEESGNLSPRAHLEVVQQRHQALQLWQQDQGRPYILDSLVLFERVGCVRGTGGRDGGLIQGHRLLRALAPDAVALLEDQAAQPRREGVGIVDP